MIVNGYEIKPGADLRRANLYGANLYGADLYRADLSEAYLREANLSEAYLREANLSRADLRKADLRGTYLSGTNLSRADLREANIDFSCFPLWCGSFDLKCDQRLFWQLLAHAARLNVVYEDGDTEIKEAILDIRKYANKFCEYRGDVSKISEEY